jgi:hypothetical protein
MKSQINHIIDYHINRAEYMFNSGNKKDAKNLYSEIREWIVQKEDIEVTSLDYINGILSDF